MRPPWFPFLTTVCLSVFALGKGRRGHHRHLSVITALASSRVSSLHQTAAPSLSCQGLTEKGPKTLPTPVYPRMGTTPRLETVRDLPRSRPPAWHSPLLTAS